MKAISLDLGGTNLKAGLFEKKENEVHLISEKSIPVDASGDLFDVLLEIKKIFPTDDITAISLAFPGIVDHIQKIVLSTSKKFASAERQNIEQWIKKHFGEEIKFYIQNDARMALLGEVYHGESQGIQDLVLVTLGTGFGSAAMINGELLYGKHFLAGNLGGHYRINLHGDPCNCGGYGCIESETSGWKLKEKYKKTYKQVFLDAANGDKKAIAIKDHALDTWAAALINLIHSFDPEKIVLSGGPTIDNTIVPELQKRVDSGAWTPWGKVEISKSYIPNSLALWGGASLIFS